MSDFGKVYEEWERLVSDRGEAANKASQKPAGSGKKLGPSPKRAEGSAERPGGGSAAAKASAKPKPDAARQFSDWLDRHMVPDKDGREEAPATRLSNRDIDALPIEASIDLHGLTARDAEAALEAFFRDAARRGLRKVLVVHGIGRHSETEAVLPGVVRKFLERSPYAGRSGYADKASGGKGAVWVLVRPAASHFSR